MEVVLYYTTNVNRMEWKVVGGMEWRLYYTTNVIIYIYNPGQLEVFKDSSLLSCNTDQLQGCFPQKNQSQEFYPEPKNIQKDGKTTSNTADFKR